MNGNSYPVTVAVRRSDGSIEHVRVGSAVREGDGFRVSLGELFIGAAEADARPRAPAYTAAPAPAPPPAFGGADPGLVFPPYGRSKGMPIAGATRQDLEFYANGCRRTLGDPAKSRWHEKERVLLAAIEAELARTGGAGSPGAGAGGGRPARDEDYDGPPPRGDDDRY